MEGFLRLVHEYAYMIAEQLYDNLGGRLDIQIFTVEGWIHYIILENEEMEAATSRIHNTSFHSINSRNVIFQICDVDRSEKQKKRTEEENKKAKATSFEKLKSDVFKQIEREPYRNSPVLNFVEPTPGCHYDIGNSHGYVAIPLPPDYLELTEIIEEEK